MATRVGWIGTGHIHMPGLTHLALERGVECGGVWDHDAQRAQMNAEKLGGAVRPIADMAGDESIDGFIICSETVHHLDLVEQLVGARKPIFIEKPMGFDAENSIAICRALEDHGIVFQTGYNSRGRAPYRALRRRVKEGFFGQITRVRASNCHNGALNGWFDAEWRWMADRSQSGVGAFGDIGTHALDVLLWIFGGVSAVTGVLGPGTSRYPGC
ncbi:MAG TPA: Gfo/Idh/MocA family oxidoreductase, partial [Fimbriimonadaceae bacterium]|nr:Gfo/Idh/MocA family oxidoreductase [Fimbriimonadaceae bacterium]